MIIKSKFFISLIDNLMDELYDSYFFSELDLRFKYHQVRLYGENVKNTTFNTHYRHQEFKIISFDLTNAPVTF